MSVTRWLNNRVVSDVSVAGLTVSRALQSMVPGASGPTGRRVRCRVGVDSGGGSAPVTHPRPATGGATAPDRQDRSTTATRTSVPVSGGSRYPGVSRPRGSAHPWVMSLSMSCSLVVPACFLISVLPVTLLTYREKLCIFQILYFSNLEFFKFCIFQVLYFSNLEFFKFCIFQVLYFKNFVFFKFCIFQILCFSIFLFFKFCILKILYFENFVFWNFVIL